VYTQLSELLSQSATATAAEWHGALAGGVVRGARASLDHWLSLCFGSHWREQLVDETLARERLAEIENDIKGQLLRDQMEFVPALPSDEAALAERTQALADWCSGFLHGFGLAFDSTQSLDTEIRQMLGDLAEISKAEIGDPLVDESHEIAYTELTEYVRVTVQSIFEALSPERESRGELH